MSFLSGIFGPPDVNKLKMKRDINGLIEALGYRKDSNVRRNAAIALGEIKDAHAIQPLIAAFGERNEDVGTGIGEALIRIGPPAVEPMIAVINTPAEKDEDKRRRYRVIKTLGRIEDPRVVEPLISVLKDNIGNDGYFGAAALSLGQIGDTRAVDPLIAGLKSQNYHVRMVATETLGKMGGPRVMDSLVAALDDQEMAVRMAAVDALAEIGDYRAVDSLISVLKYADQSKPVPEGVIGVLAERRSGEERITHALRKIGLPAVDQLIAALKDQDKFVRQKVAQTLMHIGDVRAVEPLITALKDQDENVRWVAAEAMRQMGDARAVDSLITCLNDRNRFVRSNAVMALGKIGDTRALDPLNAALKDRDEDVRSFAADSLKMIRGR